MGTQRPALMSPSSTTTCVNQHTLLTWYVTYQTTPSLSEANLLMQDTCPFVTGSR